MRALKLISTILLVLIAVTAGIFVAAVVAVIALAVFVTGRLLGFKSLPTVRWNMRRSPGPIRPTKPGDAIDVTATEVGRESTRSLPSGLDEPSRFRE